MRHRGQAPTNGKQRPALRALPLMLSVEVPLMAPMIRLASSRVRTTGRCFGLRARVDLRISVHLKSDIEISRRACGRQAKLRRREERIETKGDQNNL
jgi:hypothetical protein